MSAIQLVYPVGKNWTISQDFAEHVATALKYGWCIKPGGSCPNGYYYPAIDWACANRTKGRIAAAGVVTKAGLDPTTAKDPARGYGNRIQVLHDNGWQTVYAHLAEWYVSVGQRVTPETVSYLTDNTGYSTGPHLHFELRDEKGVPIDPAPYLVDSIAVEEPAVQLPGLPAFPAPVYFKLLDKWEWVSIRDKPWGKIIGKIEDYKPFPVFGAVEHVGSEIWLQIGYKQYCALRTYEGRVWTEVVE